MFIEEAVLQCSAEDRQILSCQDVHFATWVPADKNRDARLPCVLEDGGASQAVRMADWEYDAEQGVRSVIS